MPLLYAALLETPQGRHIRSKRGRLSDTLEAFSISWGHRWSTGLTRAISLYVPYLWGEVLQRRGTSPWNKGPVWGAFQLMWTAPG